MNTIRDPRQEACESMYNSFMSFQPTHAVDSEQVIMGQATPSVEIHEAQHLLHDNCGLMDFPEHLNADDMSDFRPALLQFMATATPDSDVAGDILNRFAQHKDAMRVSPTSHFAPSHDETPIEFTVDNVPDAVNPVKAKLAYIQVPSEDGEKTELHLVWKVCNF
jgi:extracellular elastinolytic metalloproteinase